MTLPNDFQAKYQTLLADEAAAFFKTFDQEPVSAYRLNPLKEQSQDFSDAIPQTPWGYYGKVAGKSPEHVTGLVYSQEPAAQMVAQLAGVEEGMRVLDLAAAPGGKSTHILSYLNNTGLLVSNEISAKRSKILVENIERFGARNVVVTNESADRMAKTFKGYFDLIVFDGPCSGEGMFRKDPAACQYWDKDYPNRCSDLQKDILADALSMLAVGGSLVYSTCTWSPEENEEVVNWLLQEYDYLELVDLPKFNGMVPGINQLQTNRMYPHHFKGEGQFVAKLQDKRAKEHLTVKPAKTNLKKDQLKLWGEFVKAHLQTDLSGVLQVFGDQLYLLPQDLPDLKKVKIARNGLHLGTFKKNRFEPSFALGLALRPSEVKQSVQLTEEQFYDYCQGLTVTLPETQKNGWYQLTIGGNGLGFAKIVGATVKNYFPKGLRFQKN